MQVNKKWMVALATVGLASWLAVLTVQSCRPQGNARALGPVGGMVLTGGGGLANVNAGSGLAGSGTSSNALRVGAGSGISVDADNVVINARPSFSFVSGALAAPLDYAGTRMEWIDEFIYSGLSVDATKLGAIWGTNISGTATISGSAVGTTTRPGLLEISATTATTGRAAITTNPLLIDFGSGSWTFETTIGFPTLSTGTDEYTALLGFADTSSSRDQVDGCYFLYDRGNAATSGTNSSNLNKFSCWCANNSARTTFLMDGSTVSNESFTTVDAPVAALTLPNTNIYNLRVLMTGSTRAEFFVNGVKSCNINTNVPSGSSRLTGAVQLMIRGASTAARTINIDRTKLVVDLTAARTTPSN